MAPIVSEISFVVDLVGILNLEIVVYSESLMRKKGIGISKISGGDIYWISGISGIDGNAGDSDIRISVSISTINNMGNRKIRSIGCKCWSHIIFHYQKFISEKFLFSEVFIPIFKSLHGCKNSSLPVYIVYIGRAGRIIYINHVNCPAWQIIEISMSRPIPVIEVPRIPSCYI